MALYDVTATSGELAAPRAATDDDSFLPGGFAGFRRYVRQQSTQLFSDFDRPATIRKPGTAPDAVVASDESVPS